ncbi:MAG: DUF2079 domain-containing protein [Gaiellaceae bacterium]
MTEARMEAMHTAVPAQRVVSSRVWIAAVWLGAVAYAVLVTVESIADHDAFRTGVDTAVSDQLLWLMAHGHEPFSTVLTRPLLGIHFHPGLVLFTPLYWLDLGIPGLFAAQSIALALTAPALFALARQRGASPVVASIPAFLWLACPWVASVNLFEFRPDPFTPVLLVLSVLFAFQGRDVLLAMTMLLALSLKEDVALTYLVLGLLLAYLGRRRAGAWVSLAAAVWFVGASLAIKYFGTSYEAFGQRWAGDRGETVPDALLWSLAHPLETLSDIGSQSLLGLVALLLSTAGLALLAPSWILLTAPTVLYNALSAYTSQHDLVHHHHLMTVTGLFVAAAIGVPRLTTIGRRGRLALSAGVGAAVLVAVLGGIRVHGIQGDSVVLEPAPTRAVLERIPPGVPVAATRTLLPHLSRRVEVYTLPEPFIPIDWGSSLTPDELAERAKRVRFVAYAEGDQVGTFYSGSLGVARSVPDVRPTLRREGFVLVARAGKVQIFERRRDG